jgi:hypothetical protein
MAFFVSTAGNAFDDPQQFTWHVGQRKPTVNRPIETIEADGDEKRQIAARFTNLPITIGDQPCIWKGEMAQFIYDNMYSEK